MIKNKLEGKRSLQKWEKLRHKRSSEHANAKNKLIKATEAKANSDRVVVCIFLMGSRREESQIKTELEKTRVKSTYRSRHTSLFTA